MPYSSSPMHRFAPLAIAALVGSGVAAQTDRPGDDVESARALARKGASLYDLGKYPEALAAFETAYEKKPVAALLFNIAQCHRQMGHLDQAAPVGGLGAFVGRHGGMNPASKIRGRENMMPAYIGQPAGHEKGSATALSPPRSAMFSLKPVGRRTNSERFRSAPRTRRPLRGRLSVRQTD